MADFALLELPNLISRKIYVIEKSYNFHNMFYQLVSYIHFVKVLLHAKISTKVDF